MKYRVSINDNNKAYGLDRDFFEEGEKVMFQIPQVTDVSIRVTSDEADPVMDHLDRIYIYYSFTMPAKDVFISVRMHNDMTALPVSVIPDVLAKATHKVKVTAAQGQYTGYCPECGAKIAETTRFCPECGHKLC